MGFIVTGLTAVDDLGAGSRTSFSVVRDCLMRCAYQAYIQVTTAVFTTDAKKPIRQDGLLHFI